MCRLAKASSALAIFLSSLPRRWYSKADLIAAAATSGITDPEAAFALVREAGKRRTPINGCIVHVMGERRGTQYAFGQQAPDGRERTASPSHCTKPGLRDFPVPSAPPHAGSIEVIQGDNLGVLRMLPDESFDLIYVDPPFNTGHAQVRTRIRTERADDGDRVGFQGKHYRTTVVGTSSYEDSFCDYMSFLVPRLEEAYRLLSQTGSFFLHLDYREVHYAKVALDRIFGRESFINEIVWAYDYGARSTSRWSAKHDNILWYAKDPNHYCFNFEEMDRTPYITPGLLGEEKPARGKTPTDTWWNTIVSPNGKEKTGYPTQKPLAILNRIVRFHSKPGDHLLDFFAGSGSFGEAGASCGRNVTLIDENPEAIEVMRRRFANYSATLRGASNVESPFATYHREPARGTRSNTECSVISRKTGEGVPWRPTKVSST